MDRLDHGLLNLPLHKRGGRSIDAEIDAYKKRLAAQEKAAHRAMSADRDEGRTKAKALIERLGVADLTAHAQRMGLTPAKAKKELLRRAHWRPDAVIASLAAATGTGTTEQVAA